MKRGRDALEESQRGILPYATQVEIINGLTSTRAGEFEQARRQAEETFYDRSQNCCRRVNVATLLCSGNDEGVVAADWSRKVCRALVSSERGASTGPLQVETVQLVANENTHVIFAPSSGTQLSTSAASSPSSVPEAGAAPLQVTVPKSVGERVYPGDVVLLRTATVTETRADAENQDEVASTTTCALHASQMEFVGLNGLYFTDLEEWREAVMHNATCVTQWLAFLGTQAPGIAQLTQMHAASLGDDPQRPVVTGWARSLQLPLLLSVNKALLPLLDTKSTEKLRRLILSTLRLYVNLFTRAPSLVNTEYWYRSLLCEFIASPLCVIGFSMTWPASAGTMISSAWDAVVRSLADFLDFALYQVCVRGTHHMHRQTPPGQDGAAPVNQTGSAAQVETPAFLEKRAVGAIALILHRITGVALHHVRAQHLLYQHQQQQQNNNSEAPFVAPTATSAARANELVYHALEGMGHSGLLQRLTQWLQLAESTQSNGTGAGTTGGGGSGGGGGGLHALLDRVCAPPSQQDVEELFALKPETVREQMQVMQKTYTPYLSHDATRFVEAMALAAYAELYGPSARAAHVLLQTKDEPSQAGVAAVLRARGVCAARVGALTQPALTPDLLLTASLATLRHTAAYGLPVHVTLHDMSDTDADSDGQANGGQSPSGSALSCAAMRTLLQSTALQAPSDASATAVEGSVAVVIGVRLQGRPALFPAVLTRLEPGETDEAGLVTTTKATVYVLRDGDLLPDFLDTSASLVEADDWDGAADAWLIASGRADMTVVGDSPTDWTNSSNSGYNAGRNNTINANTNGRPGGNPRHAHQRQEAPVLAESRRLLPRGTAALSYQDLLERLVRLRGELQRVESATSSSSSSGTSSSSSLSGATAEAWRRVSGMWLHYFASRQAPSQLYAKSLSGTAVAALSGSGGSGKQEMTRVLQDVATSASFTPLQVAVLQTMSEVNVSAPNRGDGGGVLSSVKVVEGARGSGKTSVLYASGVVRGEVHRQARKEHQESILPIIKKATAAARTALTQAESATSFGDLYTSEGMTDLPEEVATGATRLTSEYVRLNEGLHYCTVPLLVRPYFTPRMAPGIPSAVRKQLFSSTNTDSASAVLVANNMTSVDAVMQEALLRCHKAPLTQVLLARLGALHRLGGLCSQLAAQDQAATDDGPQIAMDLLPLVMSAREIAETVQSAAATTTTTTTATGTGDEEGERAVTGSETGMPWESYITQRMWPDVAVLTSEAAHDMTPTATWTPPVAARKPFAPVAMPPTMHLTQLSAESRRGWSGVYLDEQRDVLPLLRTHVQEATRHICRLFYDLVVTMAAVSQTAKYTLLTTSNYELSQGLHLPFLWAWRPLTVLVDDVEAVSDAFLSMLPQANHLTVAVCSTSPSHTERNRQLPMMLLKEIEHAVVMVTAVLRERLRCDKDELQEALVQLCGNGDLHNAPFNEYALSARRRRELAAAKAAAAAALDEDGGDAEGKLPVSTMGRGVTAVTDPGKDSDPAGRSSYEEPTEPIELSFRGVVSASAIEVWTHAVPTALGETADHTAARFMQRYLASYGVTSSQIITAFPNSPATTASASSPATTAVCLPFLGEAQDTYVEECDVAIVCLTSLALRAVSMAQRRRVRRDDRGRPWADMQRAKDGLFAQRLQHWLWHAVACARTGVIVIGSGELFAHVPLLRGLEAFALHHRCTVPRMASQRYWLPEAAESGTLALRCPAHDKCRRTATVRVDGTEKDLEALLQMEADEETAAVGVEDNSDVPSAAAAAVAAASARLTPRIDVRGAHQCLSLCLQPYDACERRSHACLHPCHTQQERLADMDGVHVPSTNRAGAVGASAADGSPSSSPPPPADTAEEHTHCPFPCCKLLSCGHLCSKMCGDVCDPCTFAGLRELGCGQRVVSGVNNNQEVTYEVFHHFQEAPCGSPPRVCEVLVSVPCPRCGFKMSVPCYEVTASVSRARVAAGERSKTATPEPSVEFSLPETECTGCVTVYNRVAHEFGYPALPVPPSERQPRRRPPPQAEENEESVSDRDVDEEFVESASLPRHTLSADAQAKLSGEFSKAVAKTRLRTKAEALNISCGRTTDDLDYVQYKKAYAANKATLAQQEQVHQTQVKASVTAWEQRLRKDITAQVQLNAELETMLPLLVSEAEREATRQLDFPY